MREARARLQRRSIPAPPVAGNPICCLARTDPRRAGSSWRPDGNADPAEAEVRPSSGFFLNLGAAWPRSLGTGERPLTTTPAEFTLDTLARQKLEKRRRQEKDARLPNRFSALSWLGHPRQARPGRPARGRRALAATLGGDPLRHGGDAGERPVQGACGTAPAQAAGRRPVRPVHRLVRCHPHRPAGRRLAHRRRVLLTCLTLTDNPAAASRHVATAAFFHNPLFSRSRLP